MITLNNKIMIKIAAYFVVLMLTVSFTINKIWKPWKPGFGL